MTTFHIDSYVKAIDNKNIDEIKILINNNIDIYKDIVFEIYNNELLTAKRLQFIVESDCKYLKITSILIKQLLEEDNFELLDIIFNNNIKLFDDEFILELLLFRKNNMPLSISELKQRIDNYKLLTKKEIIKNHKDIWCDCYFSSHIYLIHACLSGKFCLVKYLNKLGLDLNKIYRSGTSPLFYAFLSENENLVKYLLKNGAYININNQQQIMYYDGFSFESPLFAACKSGNEKLVKYLIEHGADINKENEDGKTPLFNACWSGNENLVKYLIELGDDINKKKLGW